MARAGANPERDGTEVSSCVLCLTPAPTRPRPRAEPGGGLPRIARCWGRASPSAWRRRAFRSRAGTTAPVSRATTGRAGSAPVGRSVRASACDFWAHPEEALDRAAGIGCTTFRLSVEWARLEPEAGRFDHAALARYVEILEMCASRRLEPMITLHHFTHPEWLGEEFWLRPGPRIFSSATCSVSCPRWRRTATDG